MDDLGATVPPIQGHPYDFFRLRKLQTGSLGSLRFFFIYKIMRFYLEERGMCHNQCFLLHVYDVFLYNECKAVN